ncbi:MAG: adenylate kinase [Gaiellaceae bacterium]
MLLLGPPGGGKGTHAERLAREVGVPHVAVGDMLRREVAAGTERGRQAQAFMDAGQLVPDDLVVEAAVDRLSQPDAADGWILDGFPRTLHQARILSDRVQNPGLDLVLVLEVPDEEVFDRISGRRSCPRGHVYHVERNPPQIPGICDEDGEPLHQREDAAPEVIRRRLEIYKDETRPVLDFYEQQGLLRRVTGLGTPAEVHARVVAALRDV